MEICRKCGGKRIYATAAKSVCLDCGHVQPVASTFEDWRRAGDKIAAACEGGRDVPAPPEQP